MHCICVFAYRLYKSAGWIVAGGGESERVVENTSRDWGRIEIQTTHHLTVPYYMPTFGCLPKDSDVAQYRAVHAVRRPSLSFLYCNCSSSAETGFRFLRESQFSTTFFGFKGSV